jgi:hypothetical protein
VALGHQFKTRREIEKTISAAIQLNACYVGGILNVFNRIWHGIR